MYTGLDSTAKDRESLSTTIVQTHSRQSHISFVDISILIGLTLAALLPRIILALQLDMVTDEVVYIGAGKIYFPLLEHLKIGAKGWSINYEHPPLVKLLIGLSLSLNTLLAHPLDELLAARIPSIIMGTLLVIAIYWLGRAPVGRVIALLAALCLAWSPWLVYFSALAYLDITMTAFITIAYLLFWYAPQRPALYPLAAILVGLGAASKYPAVLAIPAMVLFTAYYFFLIRPRLPVEQRPKFPWGWWVSAIILSPLTFLAVDPAIWPSPYNLLNHSFRFEWEHSVGGHLIFMAGQYSMHAPHWAILYILLTKMSLFVTVSAALFACYALIQLVRFHLHAPGIQMSDVTSLSFILIWLIAVIGMFSLFTIVVGTHYELPAAPPVALAGAYGLAKFLGYRQRGYLFSLPTSETVPKEAVQAQIALPLHKSKLNRRAVATVVLLTIVVAGPHLIGLVSIPDAEGYSSELFHGENTSLQVAYPGYRDALQWLEDHTHGRASVGVVTLALMATGVPDTSWFSYNKNFSARYHIVAVYPGEPIPIYDYLIFPMNLIQRGMTIPAPWKYHIIHTVSGGNTTYCYITARTSSDLIERGQRK
jgi:hypothetical protein